jgi:hypothetical protein
VFSPPTKIKTRVFLPALCPLAARVALFPANSQAQEPHAVMPPTVSLTTPVPMPAPVYRSPRSVNLRRVSEALRATHAARILAIGSSSTAGVGASSPSRSYVARLETDLETALKGTDFEVVGHGLSGEIAQGAADRMKREVEDVNLTS